MSDKLRCPVCGKDNPKVYDVTLEPGMSYEMFYCEDKNARSSGGRTCRFTAYTTIPINGARVHNWWPMLITQCGAADPAGERKSKTLVCANDLCRSKGDTQRLGLGKYCPDCGGKLVWTEIWQEVASKAGGAR
jgi:ribosomal protein L33